ncbi:MAG TPA: DUF4352 domain-containing protein [Candidatus Saccharimonadales bacterium]|nr:DUF4352 domain-containing protein [Candidatus Saccharimonadales bacterium]
MAEKEGNWFKRHKILTVILVLAVVGIIVSTTGGETSTTKTNNETSEPSGSSSNKQAKVAKLGEPARDGKFEFTVTKMSCGQKTIGNNEFTRTTAQGEFCIMDLRVKNIGNEPQTLFADNQYVYNTEGQKYSYDSDAVLSLDDTANVWLEEINPGNTVKGKLVFDVPKGTKVTKAELHDSTFSNGIEVNLK